MIQSVWKNLTGLQKVAEHLWCDFQCRPYRPLSLSLSLSQFFSLCMFFYVFDFVKIFMKYDPVLWIILGSWPV